MAKHFSYRALIRRLENLYAEISLIVLHKRINSYHGNATYKEHAKNIKTPLMEFIETTIKQAVKTNNTNNNNKPASSDTRPQPDHPAKQQSEHHQLSRERIDELSKYFKKRNKATELHPPIKKQLEHSVWEHLHAALRYAGKGDKRNSKMHADIVDSACKELAHYMDEEPYLAFITDVEEHLAALKTNHKNKDS